VQRQSVPVLDGRPGVLDAQGRLEGPGRPTGFVAQSQSQSVSQGQAQVTQRVASGDRMGKDDIVREVGVRLFVGVTFSFFSLTWGWRA
jgi:hypothetical protein